MTLPLLREYSDQLEHAYFTHYLFRFFSDEDTASEHTFQMFHSEYQRDVLAPFSDYLKMVYCPTPAEQDVAACTMTSVLSTSNPTFPDAQAPGSSDLLDLPDLSAMHDSLTTEPLVPAPLFGNGPNPNWIFDLPNNISQTVSRA
jgi:hypothetical protein